MKLFSKAEAQATSKQTKEQTLSEIALLEKTLVTLQQRINTENDNFEKQLARQRKVYGDEKIKLQEEVRALEQDIKNKEAQRSKIVIPAMEVIEKCKAVFKKVQDKLKEVTQREEELDEQLETIHSRLDDISTREGILEESEQKLLIRKESTEAEAKVVSDGHARLNGMLSDFHKEVTSKTKALENWETNLKAKELAIQVALDEHKKQKEKDNIINKDLRQTLERGFAELRHKQQTQ